jgi:hypothetical protein
VSYTLEQQRAIALANARARAAAAEKAPPQRGQKPDGVFQPVGDFVRPVKRAWNKLATDTKADYERSGRIARGELKPSMNPLAPENTNGPRLAANLFSLAASPFQGAIDATVSRPAARVAIGAGLPVYETRNIFNPAEYVGKGLPRRLTGEDAEAAVAGDINTALMGARAGPKPVPRPVAARKPAPAPAKRIPTLDDLTTQRKAAYKAVEQSGHQYAPQEFAKAVADIKAKLKAEQFDPEFHPKADLMLKRLEARAANPDPKTLSELDDLRKFINKNVRGDQGHLGGVMSRGVDEFIDAQGGQGSDLVGRARSLYKAEQKVKEVTKLQAKSQRQAARSGSGGNFDNATRQNMDKILERNPYLTADERAALEDIVMGGKAQNALRAYGKTSPLSGGLSGQMNIFGGVLTGGAGVPLHTVPSSVAKIAADNITRKKVAELIDLMAVGGSRADLLAAQQQAKQISGPAGSALQKMVAAKLAELGAAAPRAVASGQTAAQLAAPQESRATAR